MQIHFDYRNIIKSISLLLKTIPTLLVSNEQFAKYQKNLINLVIYLIMFAYASKNKENFNEKNSKTPSCEEWNILKQNT